MLMDIIHSDQTTDFTFSGSIVQRACGYSFCKKSETTESFSLCHQVEAPNKLDHKIKVPMLAKHFTSSTECDKQNRSNQTDTDSQKSDHFDREDLYKKMKEGYDDHKIDLAYKLGIQYKKMCTESKVELTSEQAKLMKAINSEMEDVLHYEHIINQEGWKLQKQKTNLKVSTKIEENTVGVLIQAQLDIPIQHFLSVLIEVDLMKNYMPFMEESKQEKVVSRNCRIGHSVNNFPILSKRQAFFQGIGYDRMDHNRSVILYSRSLNDRPDLQELLDYKVIPTKGAVELDYRYFVMEYRPIGPKQGSLKMAINIDLKLRLPMWILVPATQNFGIDFYKNILKIAKDFSGSPWQERAKQNPAFFDLVHRRIEELFKQSKESIDC